MDTAVAGPLLLVLPNPRPAIQLSWIEYRTECVGNDQRPERMKS